MEMASPFTKKEDDLLMLQKRWDVQLIPLLAKPIAFTTVMQTLAKHFNLKQEKKKLKEEE